YAHQSSTIEPSLLTNRLHHLQQFGALIAHHDDDECYSESQPSLYYQRNPHSTSYNGLTVDSNVTNASDNYYEQQNNNSNW
ncbi:unnamed protein product, partial [Rotaria magnacalcarata]